MGEKTGNSGTGKREKKFQRNSRTRRIRDRFIIRFYRSSLEAKTIIVGIESSIQFLIRAIEDLSSQWI
jgi:hypothetical protein